MTDQAAGTRCRIAHVTLQPLGDDARVQRAVAALEDAGFDCPVIAPGRGFDLPVMTFAHKMRVALTYGPAARIGIAAAKAAFFSHPHHRRACNALVALAPDGIHAHDWDGLIVGAEAARRLRVPFVYDAHEFASTMHAERLAWRIAVAPLIAVLEAPEARRAAFVVTVGRMLAERMQAALGLARLPIVLRNIPRPSGIRQLRSATTSAGAQSSILLHYHGILARGRGIEAAIEAIDHLPERFRLRLTGPWRQPGFEARMTQKLSKRPVDGRITVHPPVPHAALVKHAASADIGLCLLSGKTSHDRAALPNKIFEYLQAGLAIVASGSDEIAALLAEHACGKMLPTTGGLSSGEALANLLMKIDGEQLAMLRQNAARAAQAMTFDKDAAVLISAWNETLAAVKDGVPFRAGQC